MTNFDWSRALDTSSSLSDDRRIVQAYEYEGKSVGAFIGCIGGIGVSLATNSNEAIFLLETVGGTIAGTLAGYVTGISRGYRAVQRKYTDRH